MSLLYSSFKGSMYVPSKKKEVEEILKSIKLKKGQVFMDIGCGDGRVVQTAVKNYKVQGIGIDINPMLILIARSRSLWMKIRGIKFKTQNIFNTDLKQVDVLYIFLLPELIKKITPKLQKELKKGALVISHGFRIMDWEKKLTKTRKQKPFPTYFYRV